MGLKDWRTRRSIRDPVRGEFTVTGSYAARPGSSSFREMLTGVVTGPGIIPTAAEHPADAAGRWAGHEVLPITVDRSNPARFLVLWDEIPTPDQQTDARHEPGGQTCSEQAPATLPGDPSSGDPSSGDPPSGESASGDAGAEAPDVAELIRGVLAGLPNGTAGNITLTGTPLVIDGGTTFIDLASGHLAAADAERLCKIGEPATAVVTAVADVPVPQVALPGPSASLCDLTLQVTRPDGISYTARTRLAFPNAQRRAAVTSPGTILPIRIDPADLSHVAIDIQTFKAQHPNST